MNDSCIVFTVHCNMNALKRLKSLIYQDRKTCRKHLSIRIGAMRCASPDGLIAVDQWNPAAIWQCHTAAKLPHLGTMRFLFQLVEIC